MAVGMYYQPSTEMAEITNLEGNIAKLDHKIENLKMQEKNIAEKYGTDVQNLAFIK
jgi:TolA-binding protein